VIRIALGCRADTFAQRNPVHCEPASQYVGRHHWRRRVWRKQRASNGTRTVALTYKKRSTFLRFIDADWTQVDL